MQNLINAKLKDVNDEWVQPHSSQLAPPAPGAIVPALSWPNSTRRPWPHCDGVLPHLQGRCSLRSRGRRGSGPIVTVHCHTCRGAVHWGAEGGAYGGCLQVRHLPHQQRRYSPAQHHSSLRRAVRPQGWFLPHLQERWGVNRLMAKQISTPVAVELISWIGNYCENIWIENSLIFIGFRK